MTNKNLKISICIPYYNVSKYIKECLDSVISQNYKNIEVIIFNDGSSKEERKKLAEIVNNHNTNIKIIDSNNIGLFAARISMFEQANGDILMSLDSDDYLYDNTALSKIAEKFVNDDCEMVIYNNTRNNKGTLDKDFSKLLPSIDNLRQNFCCDDQINNAWIKAVKTSIVKNIKFDKSKYLNMCEDIYLSLFYFDNVKTVSIINKALYFYRDNEESLVRKNFDKQRLEDQEFVEQKLTQYAKKWKVRCFNEANHWFEFMIYGDIYYCFLCGVNRKKSYKLIYDNNRTQTLMDKIRYEDLPKHKKIPIKMFTKQNFTLMNLYFKMLVFVKKLLH